MLFVKTIAEPNPKHIFGAEQSVFMVRNILQYVLDILQGDEKKMWGILLKDIRLENYYAQDDRGGKVQITKKLLLHGSVTTYVPNTLLLAVLENAKQSLNIDAFTMGTQFIVNDPLLRKKYSFLFKAITPRLFLKLFNIEVSKYAPAVHGRMIRINGDTAWIDIAQHQNITRFHGQENTRAHEDLFCGYLQSYVTFMGHDPAYIKTHIVQSMVEANTGTMIRADLYPQFNKYKQILKALFVDEASPILSFTPTVIEKGLPQHLCKKLPTELQIRLATAHAEIGKTNTHGVYEVTWKKIPLIKKALNTLSFRFNKDFILENLAIKRQEYIEQQRDSENMQLALRNIELEEKLKKLNSRLATPADFLFWERTEENKELVDFLESEEPLPQKTWIALLGTQDILGAFYFQYHYDPLDAKPVHLTLNQAGNIQTYTLAKREFKELFFTKLRQILDDEKIPAFAESSNNIFQDARQQISEAADKASINAFDQRYLEIRKEYAMRAVFSRIVFDQKLTNQKVANLRLAYVNELLLIRTLDRDHALGLTSEITRNLIYQVIEDIEDLRKNPDPELILKAIAAVQDEPDAKKKLLITIPAWLCLAEKEKTLTTKTVRRIDEFIESTLETLDEEFIENNFCFPLARLNNGRIDAQLFAIPGTRYEVYRFIYAQIKTAHPDATPHDEEQFRLTLLQRTMKHAEELDISYTDYLNDLQYIAQKSVPHDIVKKYAGEIYETFRAQQLEVSNLLSEITAHPSEELLAELIQGLEYTPREDKKEIEYEKMLLLVDCLIPALYRNQNFCLYFQDIYTANQDRLSEDLDEMSLWRIRYALLLLNISAAEKNVHRAQAHLRPEQKLVFAVFQLLKEKFSVQAIITQHSYLLPLVRQASYLLHDYCNTENISHKKITASLQLLEEYLHRSPLLYNFIQQLGLYISSMSSFWDSPGIMPADGYFSSTSARYTGNSETFGPYVIEVIQNPGRTINDHFAFYKAIDRSIIEDIFNNPPKDIPAIPYDGLYPIDLVKHIERVDTAVLLYDQKQQVCAMGVGYYDKTIGGFYLGGFLLNTQVQGHKGTTGGTEQTHALSTELLALLVKELPHQTPFYAFTQNYKMYKRMEELCEPVPIINTAQFFKQNTTLKQKKQLLDNFARLGGTIELTGPQAGEIINRYTIGENNINPYVDKAHTLLPGITGPYNASGILGNLSKPKIQRIIRKLQIQKGES